MPGHEYPLALRSKVSLIALPLSGMAVPGIGGRFCQVSHHHPVTNSLKLVTCDQAEPRSGLRRVANKKFDLVGLK